MWQSVAWVDTDTRLRALVPERADTAERPGIISRIRDRLHRDDEVPPPPDAPPPAEPAPVPPPSDAPPVLPPA